MNISTGGGTLDPRRSFTYSREFRPASWFNEGLASLYEQCGTEDGKITAIPTGD